MTEAEERRRFDYDSTGRTPQDRAIEHAGYLATSAKHLLQAINDLAAAQQALEEADDMAQLDGLQQKLDKATEALSDAMGAVRCRVYDFERRRDRAAARPARDADSNGGTKR